MFAAVVVLAGCTGDPAAPAGGVHRSIEPPPGTFTTASLARVEIEAETRPVLAAHRRAILRWEERVRLDGDFQRFRAQTKKERAALLRKVEAALTD